MVFSTKLKQLDLTRCSHKEAKHLIQTFGSVAPSVRIRCLYNRLYSKTFEIDILTMISQRSLPALKELTLDGFSFEFDLPDDVKFDLALSKLEKRTFYRCYVQHKINQLLAACTELKSLHMEYFEYNSDMFVWPVFEKLEELKLNGYPQTCVPIFERHHFRESINNQTFSSWDI